MADLRMYVALGTRDYNTEIQGSRTPESLSRFSGVRLPLLIKNTGFSVAI